MSKPYRPLDSMTIEEKKEKVHALKERIDSYNEDITLLYSDLETMPPRKHYPRGRADINVDGCFDPDADGYDLLADTPVEQAIQLLLWDAGLDSNTWGILHYWGLTRIGDVLNSMKGKGILNYPGMGKKRYQNIKDSLERLGFPVGWL